MLIIYAIELVPLSVGIGLHLFHDIGYILCYSFLCPFLLLFEVWVKILIICKIIKYKDVKQVFCMIFFLGCGFGQQKVVPQALANP